MWDEETVIIPSGVKRVERPNTSLVPTRAAYPANQHFEIIFGRKVPVENLVKGGIIFGGFFVTTAVFLFVTSVLG